MNKDVIEIASITVPEAEWDAISASIKIKILMQALSKRVSNLEKRL